MKMKKLPFIAACVVTVFSVNADNLDLQSRILMQRHALSKVKDLSTGVRAKAPTLKTDGERIFAFVAVNDGYSSADLEEAGMKVHSLRGDVAIVSLPLIEVNKIAAQPCIRKMSLQQELHTNMDRSRSDLGIDAIHDGSAFDVPYTGKGVLAAVIDQGVDPNHISFLDSEGMSRVKYLSYYDGTADRNGLPYAEFYGQDLYDIDEDGNNYWLPTADKFVTDVYEAYHGTHTLNILGGGYKGYVSIVTQEGGAASTVSNPYYGAAPEADLAVSCGSLADACVALGLNGILDYAAYRREVDDMPSVISISLGQSTGPHDPDALMNRFLAECGKESIIVVSAGNEGDLKIALSKNLTADDNSFASMVYPYGYRYDASQGAVSSTNTYARNGAVMIYGSDATPFTIKAFVMTGTQGNYRRRATFDISSEEGNYFLSDTFYADYVGGSVNSTVARYFDGYIGGGSMYDADLGRYYGAFDYYLLTKAEGINEDGSEGVVVGFEVIGSDGQRIECYCDGMNTWLYNYGMDDYMDGRRDGTISDMAVGDNILVVGAYTLRDNWVSLDGSKYGYTPEEGFVIDDIAQYSSYGTLADGRTLPHVCAPGSAVISAVSSPFIQETFKGHESYIPTNFQASASANGKTYYWINQTGTSMSTPMVAGSIALWLEANPNLSIDDVLDIVKKTAKRDEFVENGNQVQWGAGKFDAVAGLKEVINRTGAGINGVVGDGNNDRLILTSLGGGRFEVFVGETSRLDVKVFSLTGNCVFSHTYNSSEAIIDLSSLAQGIYVVQVNNHARKIRI